MHQIPRNGKRIDIWEDSIMHNPLLKDKECLQGIKYQIRSEGILKLHDLSSWSENGDYRNWKSLNVYIPLRDEFIFLLLELNGKYLMNKKDKEHRGWGLKLRNVVIEGYGQFLLELPESPPSNIWNQVQKPEFPSKINVFHGFWFTKRPLQQKILGREVSKG